MYKSGTSFELSHRDASWENIVCLITFSPQCIFLKNEGLSINYNFIIRGIIESKKYLSINNIVRKNKISQNFIPYSTGFPLKCLEWFPGHSRTFLSYFPGHFLFKNVQGISNFKEMEQQSSFQISINLIFLKFINFQDFPGHFFISRTFQDFPESGNSACSIYTPVHP